MDNNIQDQKIHNPVLFYMIFWYIPVIQGIVKLWELACAPFKFIASFHDPVAQVAYLKESESCWHGVKKETTIRETHTKRVPYKCIDHILGGEEAIEEANNVPEFVNIEYSVWRTHVNPAWQAILDERAKAKAERKAEMTKRKAA